MQETLQADNDIFDESTLPPVRRTSAIGERLRLAREALVVSQAKFALRAGVSPIAYNQYELGKTQPAIDKVIKIRDARCLTENSYHDVRDLAVHWEPAARDDLRWYEWIYWIARVLVDEVLPRSTCPFWWRGVRCCGALRLLATSGVISRGQSWFALPTARTGCRTRLRVFRRIPVCVLATRQRSVFCCARSCFH